MAPLPPTTAQVLLQSANQLSRTLQLQQQLVQRQQAQEDNFKLRLENMQAERDQAKIRADQAEQRLQIQQQTADIAQQRLTLDTRRAAATLELQRQRLALSKAGAGSMALNKVNDHRRQQGAQLLLSDQGHNSLREFLPNMSEEQISRIQQDFAQGMTVSGVTQHLATTQERLREFEAEIGVLPPQVRPPDAEAQLENFKRDVEIAQGLVSFYNRHQDQIEQITPQTAPPDVVESAGVVRDLTQIEEDAFGNTAVGVTQRTVVLGDLKKGDISSAVTTLSPLILDANGQYSEGAWRPFNNWIVSQMGAQESKELRLKLRAAIANQQNQNATGTQP